ncbi:MAG: hypothetical protein IJW81_12375 [Clostridia bacterium]|nr:hypothetical protein [Clostridia bacterium]
MNNEVKKLPENDPKGYGPKKPVIIDMAQQVEILMQKIIQNDDLNTGHFQYVRTGKMRFIGANSQGSYSSPGSVCKTIDELMPALKDLLKDHASVIPFLCQFCHHGHKEIGVEEEHWMEGYFFREGTPVPDGADYFDILSEDVGLGIYLTRDVNEDWCPRYDQTRDRILGDGNLVPYPIAYWDSGAKIDLTSKDDECALAMILPAVIDKTYDTFLDEIGMK